MVTQVLVPPLGQTVDTVTLISWYKNEGERVVQGEPLFAIETDKATLDVESPASGVLRQVGARPGDEVKALSAIALIAEPDEAPASPEPLPQAGHAAQEGPAYRPAWRANPGAAPGQRVFVSPRARRLAEEHSILWRPCRLPVRRGPSSSGTYELIWRPRRSPITSAARRWPKKLIDWRTAAAAWVVTRDDVGHALQALPGTTGLLAGCGGQ
jgi:hypothetical protein